MWSDAADKQRACNIVRQQQKQKKPYVQEVRSLEAKKQFLSSNALSTTDVRTSLVGVRAQLSSEEIDGIAQITGVIPFSLHDRALCGVCRVQTT